MGRLNAVYAALPVWAQHGAVSAYGAYWHWLRFGSGYRQYVTQYLEREHFQPDEWAVWQRFRLKKMLRAAATCVPYYQNAWSTMEKAAAHAGRLEELPLLEKSAIRLQPSAFLRQDMRPRPRLTFHTSGTTGTPLASIWSVQEVRNSLALREVRSARWAGVSFSMPRATFSGRMVEPNPDSSGPFHRFNLVEGQTYLSPFHLRAETARSYVDSLRKNNVQWLTGYAVSYYLLGKFILDQGLHVPPLRAIITTSEKVTPKMRHLIESAYKCRVYEEYSTVESALFASECDQGRLHVSPDVAVVEVLHPDGSPCEPGEPGEVVATCLLRDYQLFIRYRLGDLAMWDTQECPCGRAMPVLKEVVGRIEDVVLGSDGRQMVRFHGVFVDQPHVLEGQIVQESLTRFRVRVVPVGQFGSADIEEIKARMAQRLGPNLDLIVETVDRIPRTPAGKFKAVVSQLRDPAVAVEETTNLSVN